MVSGLCTIEAQKNSMSNSTTQQPPKRQRLPSRPGSRGSQQLDIFQRFAPDYAATPYWSLEAVAPDESLPGQRYRLTLSHGNLCKTIPVQLYPNEADLLFGLIRELDCDFRLDIDKTGQIASDEARSALNRLMEAALGGAS